MSNISKEWSTLINKLEKEFNTSFSLKGVLYLIGVQEINLGIKEFSKEEKIDVLHIATCCVLSHFGYYVFEKIDSEGWPHYKELKAINSLSKKEQELLLKKAILKYLN